MDVIDDLRSLSVGDRRRVETAEGDTYTVHVESTDYVEPDEYGAGHLEVDVAFDTDVHDVPTDELPEETGTIVARRENSDSLGRPKLSVRAPYLEGHTGRQVETWDTLGWVAAVEDVDDERASC